ncbi:cbb3-type cytochrome oxidase assembly protein CcoS [uncultured Roseobacter sp.]|nr:cbb3-type cytochrome oxidase assembly protein CcoS [uncultured Roseobacter sp.]
MNALLILVPVSILSGICGVLIFVWLTRDGQLSDPEGNKYRIFEPDELE